MLKKTVYCIFLLLMFNSFLVLNVHAGLYNDGYKPSRVFEKDSFYQSVNYNPSQGLLYFTIPEIIPEGYKLFLHVSGRLYMDNKNNCMSFHAFDEESENFSWISGKTYTYSLKPESINELLLIFGLIDRKNHETLYAIHILPEGTKILKVVH